MTRKSHIEAARKTIATREGRTPSRLTKAMTAEAIELGTANFNAEKGTSAKKGTKKVTMKMRAERIYRTYYLAKGWTRKRVLERMMTDLDIGDKYAANYFQRFGVNGSWAIDEAA